MSNKALYLYLRDFIKRSDELGETNNHELINCLTRLEDYLKIYGSFPLIHTSKEGKKYKFDFNDKNELFFESIN